jgi:hypothetical protein
MNASLPQGEKLSYSDCCAVARMLTFDKTNVGPNFKRAPANMLMDSMVENQLVKWGDTHNEM